MTEYEKIYQSAKRPVDLWTNYLYYNFSMRFVWLIRKTSITPNHLTLFSLLIAAIGCFGFAIGTRPMVITGLVLVQISYVLDCADGQLARYKQQFSAIGGWLDQMADRIKEFCIYFSLAYGYTRFHTGASIWAFAMIALFALYLLEYYGQIMKIYRPKIAQTSIGETISTNGENIESTQLSDSAHGTETTSYAFTTLRKIRRLIPFHGFHIGEQYAVLLFFVAFHAIYPFFVFSACLGLLMDVYRPIVDFMKIRRGTE